MPNEKEKIYLTDITLHTKDCRQTLNFARAAVKGRMYSPVPKGYNFVNSSDKTDSPNGKFKISITLPPDLQEKLARGEAELMMPEGGLPTYAGKDVYEKLAQMKEQERIQIIHRNRDNVWRKE